MLLSALVLERVGLRVRADSAAHAPVSLSSVQIKRSAFGSCRNNSHKHLCVGVRAYGPDHCCNWPLRIALLMSNLGLMIPPHFLLLSPALSFSFSASSLSLFFFTLPLSIELLLIHSFCTSLINRDSFPPKGSTFVPTRAFCSWIRSCV